VKQFFQTTWQGIEIEIAIAFVRSWSSSFEEIYGCPMSHLEVIQPRRQALPLTETGYRSHFVAAPEVDAEGGPVAYVPRWLDWVAQDESWQDTRQLECDL